MVNPGIGIEGQEGEWISEAHFLLCDFLNSLISLADGFSGILLELRTGTATMRKVEVDDLCFPLEMGAGCDGRYSRWPAT